MAQGKIEVVRRSKSGSTLSVKVDDNWFTTKNWEFEPGASGPGMVGHVITFEPSPGKAFPDGTIPYWINEYGDVSQSTTPAAQAFDQAHAQQQPPPDYGGHGQPPAPPSASMQPQAQTAPQTDKELTITALALVKCIEGITTPQQAYEKFNEMKRLLSGTSDVPYDDSLPYQ